MGILEIVWRATKALIYAVLAMLAIGFALTLMAWTKGLFTLVVIFGVLVWVFYETEKRNAAYKAKKEKRGW